MKAIDCTFYQFTNAMSILGLSEGTDNFCKSLATLSTLQTFFAFS